MLFRLKHKYQEGEGDAGNGGNNGGSDSGTGGADSSNSNGNWRDVLPDDIKGNAALANFTDIGQMAKSFVDMKSYQGNSIHIPGEDAGEEQRSKFTQKLIDKVPNVMMKPDFDNAEQSKEFYRTIGMPEKSEGYEMDMSAVPKDMPLNEEKIKNFREMAHDAGLSKSQFTKIMGKVMEGDVADLERQQAAQSQSMTDLKTEWGMATDERMGKAKMIAQKTGAPEALLKAINDNQAESGIYKWLFSLSESIGVEGMNLNGNPDQGGNRMTPDEAKEKINEIYANREHPFHRGDKEAMAKMIKLVTAANPGQSTDINSLRTGTTM